MHDRCRPSSRSTCVYGRYEQSWEEWVRAKSPEPSALRARQCTSGCRHIDVRVLKRSLQNLKAVLGKEISPVSEVCRSGGHRPLSGSGVSWRRRSALSAACIAAALFFSTGCGSPRHSVYPVLQEEGGLIRVDLSEIESSSGRFFTYLSPSGQNVDYFVYKDSTGSPRAVLDACRSCYRWKRGYRLEGNHVVCSRCDLRFPLDGLAEGTGSCIPIGLPGTREEGTFVISVSDLKAGEKFF